MWAGVVMLLALGARAQEKTPLQTLLVDVDHRQAVSLDGPWHYLVEQPPAGNLYRADGTVRDDGYAMNTHPNISSGPHNAEYDFAVAPMLKVPGDWNTQEPTLFRFEGVVWYQRDFDWQPKGKGRTFLHVGAANERSYVWVNAKRICSHEGGFTPFDCEVTQALHPGKNFVVIAVDSTRQRDAIPSVDTDWFDYGGLTRDVSLVTVPQAFVDDFDVHLRKEPRFEADGPRVLTGYVHVEAAKAGTSVALRIPELGVQARAVTNADGRAEFQVKASRMTLWSPESPKLYRVVMEAGEDKLEDEIGFRDVRVEGTRILLNGKAVFLQGANAHAEAPYRTGRVCTDEDVRNVFGFLKALHANFVRLAHYPHDERMEREADRDGVMVWSEIPVWQRISFDKPETYARAERMLEEMVRRDRDKASVVMWSMANETPNNEARTAFVKRLAEKARTLDNTRLITAAFDTARMRDGEMVLDDPLTEAMDVVGVNEYLGWYGMLPDQIDNVRWKLPQKPVVISEFGAEAKAGRHGASTERWTEEGQVAFYEHQFKMLSGIPQLRGVLPWVLMDFRSPGRNIPGLQDGFNRKGLFSEKGERKKAFYLFEHMYAEHLVGRAE